MIGFLVISNNGKTKSVDMNIGKVYDAYIIQDNDIYRGFRLEYYG